MHKVATWKYRKDTIYHGQRSPTQTTIIRGLKNQVDSPIVGAKSWNMLLLLAVIPLLFSSLTKSEASALQCRAVVNSSGLYTPYPPFGIFSRFNVSTVTPFGILDLNASSLVSFVETSRFPNINDICVAKFSGSREPMLITITSAIPIPVVIPLVAAEADKFSAISHAVKSEITLFVIADLIFKASRFNRATSRSFDVARSCNSALSLSRITFAMWFPLNSAHNPNTTMIQNIPPTVFIQGSALWKKCLHCCFFFNEDSKHLTKSSTPSPATPIMTSLVPQSATNSQYLSDAESRVVIEDAMKREERRYVLTMRALNSLAVLAIVSLMLSISNLTQRKCE